MCIGHDESVPVRVSADVFWYALAYLAYMVRASRHTAYYYVYTYHIYV